MRNLIKKIQARHKTQSEVMAHKGGVARFRLTYLEIVTHQDRGDLLAVIDATRALADKWREEDEIMSHGGRLLTALDCIDNLEALLNGESK